MDLGKKIALCRKEARMSQEALAAELGISRQAVSRWETGEAMPDTGKIIELSRIFSVTTDYLLLDEVTTARRYDPENSVHSVSPAAERRRRFRINFGIVMTVMGGLFVSGSLIYAIFWAQETDWWYSNWGPLLTGLIFTGVVIPFAAGVALLIAGAISLYREYLRED